MSPVINIGHIPFQNVKDTDYGLIHFKIHSKVGGLWQFFLGAANDGTDETFAINYLRPINSSNTVWLVFYNFSRENTCTRRGTPYDAS